MDNPTLFALRIRKALEEFPREKKKITKRKYQKERENSLKVEGNGATDIFFDKDFSPPTSITALRNIIARIPGMKEIRNTGRGLPLKRGSSRKARRGPTTAPRVSIAR